MMRAQLRRDFRLKVGGGGGSGERGVLRQRADWPQSDPATRRKFLPSLITI